MSSQTAFVRGNVISENWKRLFKGRVSYQSVGLLAGIIEAMMVVFGSALARFAYDGFAREQHGDFDRMIGIGFLSSLIYVGFARSAGLYHLQALVAPMRYLKRFLTVCLLVALSLTAVLFLLKIGRSFSRGTVFGFTVAMPILCCVARVIMAASIERLMARKAIAGTPVLLIGEDDELEALTPSDLLRRFGLEEAGRFVTNASSSGPLQSHVLSERLLALARQTRVKELILAIKWDHQKTLADIESAVASSPLPVRLLPSRSTRLMIARNDPERSENNYLIVIKRAPIRFSETIVKRCIDIVGASLAIFALLPILVMAACAIKLDSPGPVVFRQRRNGFDQNPFVIFKFRTMSVLEDGPTVLQAHRGDLRVTRVGQWLRRTSVDELPQLFNVLRGDMSLIGPRPHALAHDHEYKAMIGDYHLRHHLKPGITGWAQVNGLRGQTASVDAMQKRVEFDLWYINNWSLYLDLQILVRTCLEVLKLDAY